MPQPLPSNPYPPRADTYRAYSTCLGFEATLENAERAQSLSSPLACARLLGYMMIHAPTAEGLLNITKEINGCTGDQGLINLAHFYLQFLVRSFKSTPSSTPVSSGYSSWSSSANAQEDSHYLLTQPPKNHKEAKIAALMRDGYRCVVTGVWDSSSVDTHPTLQAIVDEDCPTHLAHILATTGQNTTGEDKEQSFPPNGCAVKAWAAIARFGGINFVDELTGPAIHRLENVMTLEPRVLSSFISLRIWLEPTETPNQYQLQGIRPSSLMNLPQTVTFTSAVPTLPLPDPRYLALRTACAKVAHFSGAREYVDRVDTDLSSTKSLSAGGSDADVALLQVALTRLLVSV